MKVNKLTIELFNIVLADGKSDDVRYDIDANVAVVGAVSEETFSEVVEIVQETNLDDKKLSTSFYQRWSDVTDKSRFELKVDQLIHYLTTYGDIVPGYMYIPNEVFGVVKQEEKLKPVVDIRVIASATKDAIIKRVVDYLNLGVALDEDTLDKCVIILNELGYEFKETFRNKEANIFVADKMGIMPKDPSEFLRYVIFKASESTLLIKDKQTISSVLENKQSGVYLEQYVKLYGKRPLAENFNRFKPLFLAIKKSNKTVKPLVNSISKLSKKYHKPLSVNPLNTVTSTVIEKEDVHWLKNATVFALLRALDALTLAANGPDNHLFRIRNGKMFAKAEKKRYRLSILSANFGTVMRELKERVGDASGKKVFIPEHIDYALPVTEKSFVGNIPALTRFTDKKALNVGMYWEDSMGASDLDLSSMDLNGEKVGWNARYNSNSGSVVYSGDITSAPNGAVEYIRFTKGCGDQLVNLNVFTGDANSDYDLIVGSSPKKISSDRMMESKNLMAQARKTTRNRQSILGFVTESKNGIEFVVTDYAGSNSSVCTYTEKGVITTRSLKFKNKHRLSLVLVLEELGYRVVRNMDELLPDEGEIDIDLSIDNLSKDTLMSLFAQKSDEVEATAAA